MLSAHRVPPDSLGMTRAVIIRHSTRLKNVSLSYDSIGGGGGGGLLCGSLDGYDFTTQVRRFVFMIISNSYYVCGIMPTYVIFSPISDNWKDSQCPKRTC